MAFIDLLINETNRKFGLSSQGISVISTLVSALNNQELGGFEGFLNRFRQAGLSENVNAWLDNNERNEGLLTTQQLEAALDCQFINIFTEKTGLGATRLVAILAFIIPPIVRHLSASRTVQSSQPDQIRKALWNNSREFQHTTSLVSADFSMVPKAEKAPGFSLLHQVSIAKSRGLKLWRSFPFL